MSTTTTFKTQGDHRVNGDLEQLFDAGVADTRDLTLGMAAQL